MFPAQEGSNTHPSTGADPGKTMAQLSEALSLRSGKDWFRSRYVDLMSTKSKLLGLLFVFTAVVQVSMTASDKGMQSYNWFGPNKGATVVRKADWARGNLYWLAAMAAMGIVVYRKDGGKKKFQKTPTPQPPKPPLQYGRKQ